MAALLGLPACIAPPPLAPGDAAVAGDMTRATPPALEPMSALDAWTAVEQMTPGINIGNTFDNTTTWETGWGNPVISQDYVKSLAALGFKTVRLPVAWDTYAVDGRIQPDKLRRVAEVVDWITGAGMFCVLNIHWDGGWIDSSNKERFAQTYATFSADAEKKYRGYWAQISSFFAGKNEKLVFEALNEETNFEKTGGSQQAFATLTRVNQLFLDTVRKTGGNNAQRLLLVTGYSTDITKTSSNDYKLPTDSVPHKLFISVHYYTPWQFVGMTEDADWGKVAATWGSPSEVAELNRLFDMMAAFCTKHDLPAFIGEFSATEKKEPASRVRWMTAVAEAARSRKMVPVLWDTGGEVSRQPPYAPAPTLQRVLQSLAAPTTSPAPAPQ
jgi:endoglucanase